LVVGVTSYGKGLVQRQYELPDKSGFRITIAKYFTPSGRCIQRPYKDKNKYRSMDGWLNLEEGNNIDHALEEAVAENPDSLPPIYKTLSGRHLLGGGGITPDYVVKYDTTTKLGRSIRSKNLFYLFARSYIDENDEYIKNNYRHDYKKFLREFIVNDEIIDEFRQLAESKGVEWDDDLYDTDEKYFKTFIKSFIARSLWSNNESRENFLPLITQVAKAIELFPEAISIANLEEN